MTIIELGENYAKQFILATDKKAAAIEIAEALNSLKYDNGNFIEYQTKIDILNVVGEYLGKKRFFKYQDGGKLMIVNEQDNKKFLDMVTSITSLLNE